MADKHPDQALREVIPTRADVPTMFHPTHDLLMVVPIGDIKKVGTIILPDTARIVLNEGHVIEKGPRCGDQFNVGDCVTWDANSEYRMEIDGVKFVLVREGVINMMIPRAELEAANDPHKNQLPLPLEAKTSPKSEGEGTNEPPPPVAAAQCPACGEFSSTEHSEDINHAVGCPEDKREHRATAE